ncbi:hypothetical protein O9993_13280 [Vibrio lentus]|nr:hypothetical protein [Vibrio lentus]
MTKAGLDLSKFEGEEEKEKQKRRKKSSSLLLSTAPAYLGDRVKEVRTTFKRSNYTCCCCYR